MTDYTDLIARLRLLADRAAYEPHVHHEAADAIAALVAEREVTVDTLALIESMSVHSGGEIHGVTLDQYRTAFESARDVASAALDGIGYGASKLARPTPTSPATTLPPSPPRNAAS